MLTVLIQVWLPLLSLVVLTLGNGMFNTFLVLKLHAVDVSSFVIGGVSAAYYVGMAIGAFHTGKLILSSGHIRAYAGFASLIAVLTMLHGLFPNPYLWLGLRFLSGYCMAGLFIVIESWVVNSSSSTTRGQILSFYMVAIYGAQACGQFLVGISDISSLVPFIVASMLATLSVVPITITKIQSPLFAEPEALTLRELVNISPSGTLGCLVAGMVLGCTYGLLPLYALDIGLQTVQTGLFMGVTILGGMILQLPFGMLSDKLGRRFITLVVTCSFILVCIALFFMRAEYLTLLLILIFIWGGLAFILYPLSISHACDYLNPGQIVAAMQGLLIAYGIGSTLGPMLAPVFMRLFGPRGLMSFFALVVSVLTVFIIWRTTVKEAMPVEDQQDFVPMPAAVSPIINELDPRSEPSEAVLTDPDVG